MDIKLAGRSALLGIVAGTLILIAVVAIEIFQSQKESPGNKSFSPTQARSIESVVHDYLLNNPEILTDMVEALQTKQQTAIDTQQREGLERSGDLLRSSDHAHVLGNPEGSTTIVEFFDYNCGICKSTMDSVLKVVEADDDIRVVLREFPILGNSSFDVSRVALAVEDPVQYLNLHVALMQAVGPMDTERALRVAGDMGLDVEQLREKMTTREVDESIIQNKTLANALLIDATPTFVIGDRIIPSGLSQEQLTRFIEDARVIEDARAN